MDRMKKGMMNKIDDLVKKQQRELRDKEKQMISEGQQLDDEVDKAK